MYTNSRLKWIGNYVGNATRWIELNTLFCILALDFELFYFSCMNQNIEPMMKQTFNKFKGRCVI